MKHLVVLAHPRERSFTRDICAIYVEALHERGHDVVLRDLYGMGWNPVASDADLNAMRSGAIPDDIRLEQAHVIAADVITFIHPIWWIGLPAIIKGWVDRVLLFGFAYRHGKAGVEGMLEGKRAMIFTSSGSTQAHFDESGKMRSVLVAQDLGTMEFCGIRMIEHVHFAPVGTRSTPEMIAAWRQLTRDKVRQHF